MKRQRLTCDVPHCGHTRLRWQRLCDRCFRRLPGEIRIGIAEAKRDRRTSDWQKLRRRAAEFLNINPMIGTPSMPIGRVSPDRSLELQQRITGERPEA